jgi:hypothetical protein
MREPLALAQRSYQPARLARQAAVRPANICITDGRGTTGCQWRGAREVSDRNSFGHRLQVR